MDKKTLEFIKKAAARECIYDEDEFPVIDDYAGGNVDDAFHMGAANGEILFARRILDMLLDN
jgi:hypothetical protein